MVRPRAGVDVVAKRESLSLPEIELRSSASNELSYLVVTEF
jgi:hypothetical protein